MLSVAAGVGLKSDRHALASNQSAVRLPDPNDYNGTVLRINALAGPPMDEVLAENHVFIPRFVIRQ
jgi:hypothetical protein